MDCHGFSSLAMTTFLPGSYLGNFTSLEAVDSKIFTPTPSGEDHSEALAEESQKNLTTLTVMLNSFQHLATCQVSR